ncbi:MAG TPA: protein kinase [Bryobacteraceae bacterium]|nr:protein kinase [Bryobacteraceae bacterium]
MTPSRWTEINELFNALVDRTPEERKLVLDDIRARDPQLVETVEALLEQTAASWAVVRQQEKGREAEPPPYSGLLHDRYRIVRELGRGGFGVVYLAYDERLHQKPVVVKFLTTVAPRDEWFQKKFQDEVKALARIDHPGVVAILDAGQTPTGDPFIVMQYVEGVTLRSLLESGLMERKRVGLIVQQIGQALAAAHSRGVLHRDLKPANIMVQPSTGNEIVRLIDFGIASIRDAGVESAVSTRIAGSIAYMAPEQFGGHPSAASDIFAMAVIACELLGGRVSTGSLAGSRLEKMLEARPDVPSEAIAILRKALSAEASERFQDAGLFGDQLAAALRGASATGLRDSQALEEGTLLGARYRIKREIGRGGFGVVYLAADVQLHDKPVVVKILLATAGEDTWRRKKFQGEIEALSRINHPGIVQVSDAGESSDGRPYMVTEYVDGMPLRSLVRDGGIDFGQAAAIVREIGSALEAAHECGIWHRDLKPENVIVQNPEERAGLRLKVIDFGIATVARAENLLETTDTRVAGSFRYMAPEQLMGKPEAASDIYALGIIAYELLIGKKPFDAQTAAQLYALEASDDYKKPREVRPQLSAQAERIVMKALAFHAADRYASAREFGMELGAALERRDALPVAETVEATQGSAAVYDVFVSHASRDLDFARSLVAELELRGARCFCAPDDIPAGKAVPEALAEAIQNSRCFVLILTENTNLSVQAGREAEVADASSRPIVTVRTEGVEPLETLAFFLSHARWVDCPIEPAHADFSRIEAAIRTYVPAFSGAGLTARPRISLRGENTEPFLTEVGAHYLLGPPGERQVRLIAFFFTWALVTAVLSVLGNASSITVLLEGAKGVVPVRFGYLYEFNGALAYLFVIPCFLYFALGFVQEAQSALVNLEARDQLVVNFPVVPRGAFERFLNRLKRDHSHAASVPHTGNPGALDLIAEAYRRWMNPVLLAAAFLITFLVIAGTEYLPPKSDYKNVMFGYVQVPWIAEYPIECPDCTLAELQAKVGRRVEAAGGLPVDQLRAYRIVEPYYRRSGRPAERIAFVLFMISALGLEVSFATFGFWTGLKVLFILRLFYGSVTPAKTHYVRLHLWYTDRARLFGLDPVHRVLMQLVGCLGVSVVLEVLSWWANIFKGSKRALGEDLSTLGGWGQFLVANYVFAFSLLLLIYLLLMSGKAREAASEESKRIAAIRRAGAGRKANLENLLNLIGGQSIWHNPRYTMCYLAAPVLCVLSLMVLNQVGIANAVGNVWELFLKHILGSE